MKDLTRTMDKTLALNASDSDLLDEISNTPEVSAGSHHSCAPLSRSAGVRAQPNSAQPTSAQPSPSALTQGQVVSNPTPSVPASHFSSTLPQASLNSCIHASHHSNIPPTSFNPRPPIPIPQALIPSPDFSMQYSTIDHAISLIHAAGRGAWLAKADITSAFKVLPIHPDYWHLFAVLWNGAFYFAVCLTFGLKIFDSLFESFLHQHPSHLPSFPPRPSVHFRDRHAPDPAPIRHSRRSYTQCTPSASEQPPPLPDREDPTTSQKS
ncbi:hypothetical protein D5F01_LYC01231 [Larimichthys crocea]|uniref:Reverse transcriptase domain-containing protein n=1 Tax=Larimichthys crocea TaxID=215358 RepID=A0A6G0JBF6_LARCR|nr:hypothetical protein D5F01_LYC01231 [Larimichthys crocea]